MDNELSPTVRASMGISAERLAEMKRLSDIDKVERAWIKINHWKDRAEKAEAALAETQAILKDVYPGALMGSCIYRGVPGTGWCFHCCNWGPIAERIAKVFGWEIKKPSPEDGIDHMDTEHELQHEIARLQAEAAAMKKGLKEFCIDCGGPLEDGDMECRGSDSTCPIQKDLNGYAGKAFAERMEELEDVAEAARGIPGLYSDGEHHRLYIALSALDGKE